MRGPRAFPRAQADQEAALIRRILHNQVRGGPRDWVTLNAAMLLYAAGKASSISAGVPLAQQTLDSGAAARKLDDLVASAEPAGTVHAAGSRFQQGSEGSHT